MQVGKQMGIIKRGSAARHSTEIKWLSMFMSIIKGEDGNWFVNEWSKEWMKRCVKTSV